MNRRRFLGAVFGGAVALKMAPAGFEPMAIDHTVLIDGHWVNDDPALDWSVCTTIMGTSELERVYAPYGVHEPIRLRIPDRFLVKR